MESDIRVKICGLKTPQMIDAAAQAGVAYVGFVFFPKSPRHLDLSVARDLAQHVPLGVAKVALVVNPDDAALDALCAQVPIDMIQLHGQETPERVQEVKDRTGLPVMKAVGIADRDDLAQVDIYQQVADQILVDTKPPKGADRPGGNGVTFDWALLKGHRWSVPWMLAGGLTCDNVGQAVAQSAARQLDLSSAVESAPGVKDAGLIADFMAAVRQV